MDDTDSGARGADFGNGEPRGVVAQPGARRVGEVIEASTTEIIAQSYELHDAPTFGSFVRASDGEVDVIGVIAEARTGSVDPGRRAIARGQDELEENDVYEHNPELQQILRTEFTAVIVGYRDEAGHPHQRLPRRPPRLHAFVHTLSPPEVVTFTEDRDFLQTLLTGAGTAPADELTAACLREASAARGQDYGFLVSAGKELAVLLANDLNRLSAILRRVRP